MGKPPTISPAWVTDHGLGLCNGCDLSIGAGDRVVTVRRWGAVTFNYHEYCWR